MRFVRLLSTSLLALLLIAGGAPHDALAKTKSHSKPAASKKSEASGDTSTPKGVWEVNMARGEKGEFSYCVMQAKFNNELTFAVAMSPKQEINLGITVPNAGYSKEEKHKMKVVIDNLYSKEAVAIAANPELLMIPMHQDKELLDALRKGKAIVFTGNSDEVKFTLKNAGKALGGLQQCVDVGTGKAKMPEQAAKGASGKGGKTPGFPPGLKNLLLKAGFSDLEIVPIPDPSKAPVDFAWRTNGLFGGMREQKAPPTLTLEKASDVIEGVYKKQCSGTFTPTRSEVEKYKGVDIRTMGVSCEMKERKVYVSLLIYLTDNHLFTMFMHESDNFDKAAANKARDSIAALIRQLAKEQPADAQPKAETAPAASSDTSKDSAAPTPATKP